MQGDVDGEAANDDSQDEVNKAFFDKIIKIPSTLNPANTSFNSNQIHPCFEVLVRSNQIIKKIYDIVSFENQLLWRYFFSFIAERRWPSCRRGGRG